MVVSRSSGRQYQDDDDDDDVAPAYNIVEEHKGDVDAYPQIYSAPTVDSLDTLHHTTATTTATTTTQQQQQHLQQQHQQQVKMVTTKQKLHKSEKDFQIPEDSMAVSVRHIAIAQRSAFSRKKLPNELPPALRSSSKVSPSHQHLTLIHKLQSITHTRQLAFTPSVGRPADVLAPSTTTTFTTTATTPTSNSKRDGRYRSIDPVQATIQALPHTPPLLSNKKHRLPLRSDVGFPNASMEEIQKKQQEISHETEWEEASPRLIVLVTSDDLGTAMQYQHLLLEGPELIYAKECNQRHFRKRGGGGAATRQDETTTTTTTRSKPSQDSSYGRMSVLAPPLDATFSRTMGWRPRPFHDRPPGMHYSLVCPLDIKFDVGNLEPLVCSLTLYSFQEELPGKASEDFWFPAGDWKQRVVVDSLLKDGNDDLMQAFLQRKHKAIFAHDPLLVPTKDAYVVLQVYKVSHVELAAAYLNSSSNSSNNHKKSNQQTPTASKFNLKDFRADKSGFKKKLQKHGKKDEATKTAFRANSVLDSFGTQFMSPLCFGATALYPKSLSSSSSDTAGDATLEWPRGQTQNKMQLYSYPSQAESQAEFVLRLRKIAARQEEYQQQLEESSPFFSLMEESSALSVAESSTSTRKKRGGVARLFSKSSSSSSSSKKDIPKRVMVGSSSTTGSSATTTDAAAKFESIVDTPMIAAKVSLFTSALDVDFLQSMLYTPPELAEKPVGNKLLPNVLVDASGEAAVMVDPKNATNLVPGNVKKRSDLVRLPCRDGYVDASDFREVLFLPPRPPKNYDVDVPPSYRSLFNLLYLYPRLLRLVASSPTTKKSSKQRYSVRIRLIQTTTEEVSGVIESRNVSLDSFHNPAPWAGPSLLKSAYTRIPGENAKHDIQKAGIPMRDEFKLRLPMFLDDNFFLHFSLFAVDIEDDLSEDVDSNYDDSCGISTHPVAETTVPLASSSTRDPKTGLKAMVIIPNGNHRLKLGDFQLQVETRLVSSVHVSDPAVAAALRDFPFVNDDHVQNQELAINQVVSQSSSVDTLDKQPFSDVFATASGSVLAGQFQPLLLMHLSNLVNLRNNKSIPSSEHILMETMKSFLQVCKQIKSALSSSQSAMGKARFQAFIKSAFDLFDESCLHSSPDSPHNAEDDSVEEGHFDRSRSNPSINTSESPDDFENDDEFDGGAVRKRKKDALGELEIRITRTFSARETAESPFSRVAYGASKTDRMRLEAELDNRTHYVDDDETVVTVETRMTEAREMFELTKKKMSTPKIMGPDTISPESLDGSSSVGGETSGMNDFSSYARSLGELGIAQRARSAAQIILAPCVAAAPGGLQSNLASLFTERISPHFTNAATESQAGIESKRSAMKVESDDEDRELVDRVLYSPGSDIEDDKGQDLDDTLSRSGSSYYTSEGTFRSPWNCRVLHFSITPDRNHDQHHLNLPFGRGDFIYESLLVLWLRAWMTQARQVPQRNQEKGNTARHLPYSLMVPTFDNDSRNRDSMYIFYDNLDILIPLCLKSIVLRYSKAIEDPQSRIARVIVDQGHMNVLESFVEMLALFLMGQAMQGLRSDREKESLPAALASSEYVIDFLIGLFAVFHPAHIDVLIRKYFKVLRRCEGEHTNTEKGDATFSWSEETLHRAKCSRQLRLRAVERLSVLPNFIALNYPRRLLSGKTSGRPKKSSWTMQYSESSGENSLPPGDFLNSRDDLLPKSGWLAELLTNEALSICSLSCEAVVAEAIAHIESQEASKSGSGNDVASKQGPTATLNRNDLLMFQSIAIHAITTVHELLLRRHAMDRRFQRDSSRGRIAALFTKPIFEASLSSVRWLARLESTHKVRSLWLLCFVYILQEAPENLLRQAVRSYSNAKNLRIHRFVRLLRLGSSTFQSFIDQPRHCTFPSEIDSAISPWLLQESFNTICATIIVVVEECASPLSTFPHEQKAIVQGILDLLLHVLTTPQSSVTHLRAVGGAIQALEGFGIEMFLEITGGNLQHWLRVVLGLMNSISLSVRSIAVDFVVSLLGSTFDLLGNIDEVALIFATVLPEVAAREIALHSVSGHIQDLEDVEKSVWPLRRSFADVEDASPVDDERVDPQLAPVLSPFCRACQAVIDGVFIEMRLQGRNCSIVGTEMKEYPLEKYTFDADEESLFEAASFFVPETAPMQRIRWLMTLKSLHEAKGQWVEAAESLIMCARTISDSIPHLRHVWRPSRFALWSDERRSLWLSTVGQEVGNPERGNAQVMNFADNFLEPDQLGNSSKKSSDTAKLTQPTISGMSALLTSLTKEAVSLYLREDCMDSLAYSRLESLLKVLMRILDDHGITDSGNVRTRLGKTILRKQQVEEEASLRKVIASISFDMTKLAERLLLIVEDESTSAAGKAKSKEAVKEERRPYFVRVLLSGKKPTRFVESTTLPTFLEWDTPCVCRVPKGVVDSAVARSAKDAGRFEELMCSTFGKSIREALLRDDNKASIVLKTGNKPRAAESHGSNNAVHVEIGFVEMDVSEFDTRDGDSTTFGHQDKHFVYHRPTMGSTPTALVKMTVAHPFPCPLSRQRTLLTSELITSK